jgi:hypothetical protein
MSAAHTPGPWECQNGDQVYARPSVKLHLIATVHALEYDAIGDERAANQRLIAAAPQLLAELENLYASRNLTDEQRAPVLERVRAALAAAGVQS